MTSPQITPYICLKLHNVNSYIVAESYNATYSSTTNIIISSNVNIVWLHS